MDKEKAKQLINQAIDNLPDCAKIADLYVEHSYGSEVAYIKMQIKAKNPMVINEFHEIAHSAFNTDMDFIS